MDPSSRREQRIRELLAWAKIQTLDPEAVGTFDKTDRQAQASYLVTSGTAHDYAALVLRLLRSRHDEKPWMEASET